MPNSFNTPGPFREATERASKSRSRKPVVMTEADARLVERILSGKSFLVYGGFSHKAYLVTTFQRGGDAKWERVPINRFDKFASGRWIVRHDRDSFPVRFEHHATPYVLSLHAVKLYYLRRGVILS